MRRLMGAVFASSFVRFLWLQGHSTTFDKGMVKAY